MATSQALELMAQGKSKRIALGSKIAAGGAGTVYGLQGDPLTVIKLYHDTMAPKDLAQAERQVSAMVASPPTLPPFQYQGRNYVQIAWPSGVVRRAGRFVGFAMPALELNRTRLLEFLLSDRQASQQGLRSDMGTRVTVARQLAGVVAALHERGHCIVDLKPQNLSYYPDTLYMAVLDCDGFSISDSASGARYPAPMYTGEYLAPEFQTPGGNPNSDPVAQDRFALAAIVFQLLNHGDHPFSGVIRAGLSADMPERISRGDYPYGRTANANCTPRPSSTHFCLPGELLDCFERSFQGSPAGRPSAQEWAARLEKYATRTSGNIVPCTRDPAHLHFAGLQCSRCLREGKIAKGGGQKPLPAPRPAPRAAPAKPSSQKPAPPPTRAPTPSRPKTQAPPAAQGSGPVLPTPTVTPRAPGTDKGGFGSVILKIVGVTAVVGTLVVGALMFGVGRNADAGPTIPDGAPPTAVAPETALPGSQASGGLGVDYSIDGSGVVAQILSDGFYRKPKKMFPLQGNELLKDGVYLVIENETIAICPPAGNCHAAQKILGDGDSPVRYASWDQNWMVVIASGMSGNAPALKGDLAGRSAAMIPPNTPMIAFAAKSQGEVGSATTFVRFRVEELPASGTSQDGASIALAQPGATAPSQREAASTILAMPKTLAAVWSGDTTLSVYAQSSADDIAAVVCESWRSTELQGKLVRLIGMDGTVKSLDCTALNSIQDERAKLAAERQQFENERLAAQGGQSSDGDPQSASGAERPGCVAIRTQHEERLRASVEHSLRRNASDSGRNNARAIDSRGRAEIADALRQSGCGMEAQDVDPYRSAGKQQAGAQYTADDLYNRRHPECPKGFFGSSCRTKIRQEVCAGNWSPSPPSGYSTCAF
jgi:hypothetical protein